MLINKNEVLFFAKLTIENSHHFVPQHFKDHIVLCLNF